MRRRGQIFLLLTILSITFIFAISSVLLDIQRAQYLEPSPDADKTFETWDNAVSSVEQILSIQIALNTINDVGSGNYSVEVTTQLDLLESYINSRGLIASVNLQAPGAIFTRSNPAPAVGETNSVSMTASIEMQISSLTGTSIYQILQFDITYQGSFSTNTLTLVKIVNSQTTYLTGATFTGVGIISDNENGSYDMNSGISTLSTLDSVTFDINSQ